jgi:hypothetical protein
MITVYYINFDYSKHYDDYNQAKNEADKSGFQYLITFN